MEDMIRFWQAAKKAKIGVVIKTDNRKLLKQKLYQARAALSTNEFDQISAVTPEEEDTLWLVHSTNS